MNNLHKKIKKVSYSEINEHQRKFFYDGFDSCDHGIHLQFDDHSWWHFCWKEEENFQLGSGRHDHKSQFSEDEITFKDATERWRGYLDSPIIEFDIVCVDEEEKFPAKVNIKF